MIGQILMSTKEQERIGVIEQVMRKELKQTEAADQLHESTRQLRRQIRAYQAEAAKGLVHRGRGKPSHRKIPQSEIDRIIQLVRDKYSDFGPTLALEKLQELDGITSLKVERLRQAMIVAGLWTSQQRRKAVVHQLRERRAHEGELVQVDGSPHDWFEGRGPICCLLVFIDDATGKLLWLEFCESESTLSYLKATKRYLLLHGRPLAFYSDKHGVFRINKTKDGMAEESVGLTQFGRAMKELDIEPIFANSPQAKGRVERANETLQDRLVKELRLRNISAIATANTYLPEFIEHFNQKFSVTPTAPANLHRPILASQNLDLILTIQETRVIAKNLSCQYANVVYQIQTNRSAYALRGKQVTIREDLAGQITLWDNQTQLAYTTLKHQPKLVVADSKRLTEMMNILTLPYRQKQNYWETDIQEMTDQIYL
jgi:hypothetical protein